MIFSFLDLDREFYSIVSAECNIAVLISTAVVACCTVVIYLANFSSYAIRFSSNSTKSKKGPLKSPPVAPLGMLATIRNMGDNAPFFLKDIVRKTGSDIVRLRLPIPGGAYVVGDPATMREILVDRKTDKPTAVYSAFEGVLSGSSIFTRPNTSHKMKATRKCLSYCFSSSEINRMNQICINHTNQWIKTKLEPSIQNENSETFDPSLEMTRLTLGIILEAAFEYKVQLTDEEYEHLMHHLELSLKEFAGKQTGNPFRKFYGPILSDFRNAKRSCTEVAAFGKKMLDTYRKNENKSTNRTIIRMIVENQALTSDKERISEIITMLIAGHETTGFTLASTLILLAKHPKVSKKLRRELLSMDSSKRSSRSGYLSYVIRESKRLIPVSAIGSTRTTGRDFTCMDGSMVIPKGATCFLPTILSHHNEKVFQDPDSFCPERWEKEDKAMKDALMIFAVGHRDCIGQTLAMSELYSVIPRLITEYDFELETEGELDFFLTLKCVGARLKPMRARS